MKMLAMKRLVVTMPALLLAIAPLATPAQAGSRVGIRESYLRGLDQNTVWEAAKLVGIPYLEIVVTPKLTCPNLFEGKQKPYRVDTPQNRRKVLPAAKKNGCQIIAFCTVVPFQKGAGDEANVTWIGKAAKAAADMDVPVIMMPLIARGIDQAEFLERATAFLKAVAPHARQTKVQLAVENLGPYLNKKEVLKPLMDAVPDDQVALALDIANMYWFGYPPARIYELAKTFAPHVRYAHAKSVKYPPADRQRQRKMGYKYGKYAEPIRTGDLDFEKILGYYFAAGFKGDISIEDDSLGKFDAAGKKRVIMDDAALLGELTRKGQK